MTATPQAPHKELCKINLTTPQSALKSPRAASPCKTIQALQHTKNVEFRTTTARNYSKLPQLGRSPELERKTAGPPDVVRVPIRLHYDARASTAQDVLPKHRDRDSKRASIEMAAKTTQDNKNTKRVVVRISRAAYILRWCVHCDAEVVQNCALVTRRSQRKRNAQQNPLTQRTPRGT